MFFPTEYKSITRNYYSEQMEQLIASWWRISSSHAQYHPLYNYDTDIIRHQHIWYLLPILSLYLIFSFRSFPFSFLKKEKKIYRTLILGILIDRKRKFKYFDVIKPYDAWKWKHERWNSLLVKLWLDCL